MEISVIIERTDRAGNSNIVSEKAARAILATLPVTIRNIDGLENHNPQGNLFYVEVDEQTLRGETIMYDLRNLGGCNLQVAHTLVQFRNEDLY